MGAAEAVAPPLPAGFEIDPPLPPGFELDAPAASAPARGMSAGLSQIPGQAPDIVAPSATRPAAPSRGREPTVQEKVIGAVETGLSVLTGIGGGTLGAGAGLVEGVLDSLRKGTFGSPEAATATAKRAAENAQAMTYEPRTPEGQEYTEQIGAISEQLPAYLGHIGPVGGMAASAGPARAAVVDAAGRARTGMGAALDRVLPNSQPAAGTLGSAGSAGTDMATQRRERAADLPVPVKLTKGDATRDFEQQRFEKETAKDAEAGKPLRERQADKTDAVTKNFDEFIEQTGAEATEARAVGHSVVDPIVSKAEKAKGEIREAYKAAEDAGETAELVPYTAVRDYIADQTPTTREQLAPILKMADEQLAKNDPDATGEISIQALEDVRKAIRANAEYGTPNGVQAGELIRRIDAATEGAGGDLYRKARGLYAGYAREFKEKGVIRDLIGIKKGTEDRKVAFEDVFDKAVMRGSLDDLKNVKDTLVSAGPKGEQAWRDIRGTAIEHIKKQVFSNDSKNERGAVVPSSAKFGKAVEKLDADGKLEFLFGKSGAQQMRDLRDVVSDIYTAPAGAVNTSNTTSVLRQALDQIVTFGVSGMPVAGVTALKAVQKKIQQRKTAKLVREALGDDAALPPSGKRAFEDPPAAAPAPKPPVPPPKPAPAAAAAPAPADPRLAEIDRLKADASPEVAKVLDEQASRVSAELRAEKAKTARAAESQQLERKAAETLDPEIRAALIKRANELRPEKVPAGEARELATTPTPAVKTEKIATGKTRDVTPTAEEAAALAAQRASDTSAFEVKWFADKKVGALEEKRIREVDRAIEIDPEAVYAAAVQHENSPGAMDRAIAKIIEQGARNADEGKQAAVADAGIPQGASREAGRAEPVGSQPRADGPAAPRAERGQADQPSRPAEGSTPRDAGTAGGSRRDQAREEVTETAAAKAAFDRATEPVGNPITDDLSRRLRADFEGARAEYDGLGESAGGRVLNTDVARELSPDYRADRTKSADVHEPASGFIKRVYAEKLAAPTPDGMDRAVLFTAGGTGAGKTTGVRKMGDVLGTPEIVFDTNMNSLESAAKKVEQALAAGREVRILYTYADPVQAFRQAMGRAARMERNAGSGRTVPIDEHVKTHVGAAEVVRELAKRYADDPRVQVLAVDNSRGKGGERRADLADLPLVAENGLREQLAQALDEAHRARRVSDAVRSGFLAASSRVRDEGVGGRVLPPDERSGDRGSPAGRRGSEGPQSGLTPAPARDEPGSSSPPSQALADAKRIPSLDGLAVREDGTVDLAKLTDVVHQFVRDLPEAERELLVSKDGRLTQLGAARVRDAMLAKAYGDPTALLELADSADASIKNVVAGLLRAAPEASAAKNAAGIADLMEAVQRFAKARQAGHTVLQHLAGTNPTPSAIAELMRRLEADARAPKRIADIVREIARGERQPQE